MVGIDPIPTIVPVAVGGAKHAGTTILPTANVQNIQQTHMSSTIWIMIFIPLHPNSTVGSL